MTGAASTVRRTALSCAAFAAAAIAYAAPAKAEPIGDACFGGNLLIASDTIATGSAGEIPSPCTVAGGRLLVETLYYQNASKVGGTALAAYPLVRFRTGLVKRLELVVDAPSQIAQSGLGGAGLYPVSRAGAGLNYRVADSEHTALGLAALVSAPASLYASTQSQPRYTLGLNGKYRLSHSLWLKGLVSTHSSSSIGFNQVYPSDGARARRDSGRNHEVVRHHRNADHHPECVRSIARRRFGHSPPHGKVGGKRRLGDGVQPRRRQQDALSRRGIELPALASARPANVQGARFHWRKRMTLDG